MKIVAISDIHCQQNVLDIPECDILISAGDHSIRGHILESINFINWLSSLDQVKHKVFIAGNHDKWIQRQKGNMSEHIPSNKGIIYLQDDGIVIDGITIYGTPWTPFFYDYAFNGIEYKPDLGTNYIGGPGNCSPDDSHPLLSDIYRKIWEDTDVLICHGPPRIEGLDKNREQHRCGSYELLKTLPRLTKLKCGIYGHIHESRGMVNYLNTPHYNVASLDRNHNLQNNSITIIDI